MTISERLGARIPDKVARRIWNMAVFVLACAGVYVHLWAGWTDGHEITLRPVGHGTVFVLLVWVIVFFAASFAVAGTRGRSRFVIGVALLSLLGIALLFSV